MNEILSRMDHDLLRIEIFEEKTILEEPIEVDHYLPYINRHGP